MIRYTILLFCDNPKRGRPQSAKARGSWSCRCCVGMAVASASPAAAARASSAARSLPHPPYAPNPSDQGGREGLHER
jgi:hypothetical protein